MIDQYRKVFAHDHPDQLIVNLDGKAGTGKSHVDQMAKDAGIFRIGG
jgi:hypothetical protein